MSRVKDFIESRLSPNDFSKLCFGDPWVRMPALRHDSASDYLAKIQKGLAAADGTLPAIGGVPYGTDAGPLAQKGLPCVVFGPGNIAQAHTEDEWIETDQVVEAADRYFRMLAMWETL